MKCPRCESENRQERQFCAKCGAPLAVPCPCCGFSNASGEDFCGGCGKAIALPPGASGPEFLSPKTYTPKYLAERILTSRSALEGERKQVTVLFCDIVDSSRLATRLDPEVTHEVMDRALRLMAESVHRYGGTVNQFLGDGVMALFGAPLALEDHAVRAVQAALAIKETITGYSEQLKGERGVEIRLRLGLNTGLVVVGRIGDDLRMDYTAVGDTTHLAARMQGLAEPDTILITEATHRFVAGLFQTLRVGPVSVKGRSEPVTVYRVTGRRRGRTRLEVSAERGLTPLVGRQHELDLLREYLTRAKAGRGQVVGIVGEPGVGKSRLLYEFRESLEGDSLIWVVGRCLPYGQTTPYLPLLESLCANFQIDEDDNALQLRQKLREGVRRLDPGLEHLLPILGELFGLPAEDESLKYLDPKEKRQRTFEAVRTLTVAGAQRRPHVVIVEDLHWIDRSSEDYLAFLIESVAAVPLLVLTTHRPSFAVRWADKTYYTQVPLGLLTREATEEMVAALLGTRDLPPELLRVVREKAEGNPLFIEEMTNSLLERGILVRNNGGLQWVGDVRVEIPATIQDIIRARIDRLEEPVKRTVQTAAVIGREFGVRLLTRISEMAEEVERYLETLKHVELIHEKRFFPELEYIFKHGVTQDVAYQSLLAQRRKDIHGAIGRAIEHLYPDRLEEQAPILAHHWARSDNQPKSVEYALMAGDGAARLYANTEATAYYEQALASARAQPASPEAHRAEIDATLRLASVALTREHFERDLTNLKRSEGLAERLEDQPRRSRILYWLGRTHYTSATPDVAIEYGRQALEVAERLGEEPILAPPVNLLGRIHWMRCEFAEACEFLARSVEQMHRLGNQVEEATAAGMLSIAHALSGHFPLAEEAAERGVRIAEVIGHLPTLAACLQYRGQTQLHRGNWRRALPDYERGLEMARKSGDLFRVYLLRGNLGWAYVVAGDYAQAEEELGRGIRMADQLGTQFFLSTLVSCLAECRLAGGHVGDALRLSREAIALATEGNSPWLQSVAWRVLAQVLLLGDPSDARGGENAIQKAMALQRDFDIRPELARSLVVTARLLQAKGEAERARETHAQAIGMFKDMQMAWDLERAEQPVRDA